MSKCKSCKRKKLTVVNKMKCINCNKFFCISCRYPEIHSCTNKKKRK